MTKEKKVDADLWIQKVKNSKLSLGADAANYCVTLNSDYGTTRPTPT